MICGLLHAHQKRAEIHLTGFQLFSLLCRYQTTLTVSPSVE